MARSIAVINLKGGVGKTTLAVALAETYASRGKKVLLLDLDPQTNATTMLISGERWRQLNQANLTLAGIYRAYLKSETAAVPDLILTGVGNVKGIETLDLLPSSLDLVEIQEELAMQFPAKYRLRSTSGILVKALSRVRDSYDYLILDCPPSLGLITRNGLALADWFVIPTIPDILSTYGILMLLEKVKQFAKHLEHPIEPLGIVISKYRQMTNLHRSVVNQLQQRDIYPPVLEPFIPEAIQIAMAAEQHSEYSSLRAKYGSGAAEAFETLADVIRRRAK